MGSIGMYYLLENGRIVSESELETCYEIITGIRIDKKDLCLDNWAVNMTSIVEVLHPDKVSVEQLIKGRAFVHAVKLYRNQHDCTLAEAKEACDAIRNDLSIL